MLYNVNTKAFYKLEKLKTSDPEYYLPPPASSSPHDVWLEYRNKVQTALKLAKHNLNTHLIAEKRRFISEKVQEIRQDRNSPTPSKFFKHADPDSIYQNQQQ